jgi:hypothetical protein
MAYSGRERHGDMERLHDNARHFYFLCANVLQNDPLVTTVITTSHWHYFPLGYGIRLGEAIRCNTQVTMCSLEMCALCEMDQVDDTVEPWCHFFRHCPTLQTVAFLENDFSRQNYTSLLALEHFLPALGQNHSVEFIEIGRVRAIPIEGFEELMRTTKSLKALRLDLSCIEENVSAQRLGEAFSANLTLERLNLKSGQDVAVFEKVTCALSAHLTLRELTVLIDIVDFETEPSGSMGLFDALAALLRSTTTLTVFGLETYDEVEVEKEHMNCFLSGLLLNRSITTLSFGECWFTKEATVEFVDYMQSVSGIRELRFNELPCIDGHDFEDFIGPLLAESSIRVLRIDAFVTLNFSGLCQYVTANASQIQLECLCLHLRNGRLFTDNLTFVPALTNLQELTLSLPFLDRTSPSFLAAVRRSGSLLRVSVGGPDEDHRLLAYCERNKVLDAVFTKRLTSNSAIDVEIFPALLPSLFAVAMHARRTSASVIFAGLLFEFGHHKLVVPDHRKPPQSASMVEFWSCTVN